MGQYYNPIVKNKDKWKTIIVKYADKDEFNGWKLMEHSYARNPLILTVLKYLLDNPSSLIWCGDYSNDDSYDGYEPEVIERNNKIYHLVPRKIYDSAWDSDNREVLLLPENEDKDFIKGLYLINDTKKEYIPLGEYAEINLDKEGWSVSPLSLLTAAGNGQGSGDYHDCYRNYDMVGYWMGDTVRTSYDKPSDEYKNCIDEKYVQDYIFAENELASEQKAV